MILEQSYVLSNGVQFSISKEDMEMLKSLSLMKDYGEFTRFPVFSGK